MSKCLKKGEKTKRRGKPGEYVCRSCGAVAKKKDKLCKPKRVK